MAGSVQLNPAQVSSGDDDWGISELDQVKLSQPHCNTEQEEASWSDDEDSPNVARNFPNPELSISQLSPRSRVAHHHAAIDAYLADDKFIESLSLYVKLNSPEVVWTKLDQYLAQQESKGRDVQGQRKLLSNFPVKPNEE